MGDLFATLCLDTDTRRWLESRGTSLPDLPPGRWPTDAELREVLGDIPGTQVAFKERSDGGWEAELARDVAHTLTVWAEPSPDPSFRLPFTLHEPEPELAATLLEALARRCGPYVLYDAGTSQAVVVTAGSDPGQAARELLSASGG